MVAKTRSQTEGKLLYRDLNKPHRMSFEEFMSLPEDRRRRELLAGWVVREPAPGEWHQATVVNLCWLLRDYIQHTGKGRVYLGPFDIILSRENVVQPDLLFISAGRTGIITEKNVQGAPDLAVEVVSPWSVRKDRSLRFKLYARFGIREYWIVDPPRQTVEVFVPAAPAGAGTEPRYESLGTFAPGEAIRSRVLPDFTPDPRDVFVTPVPS